MWVDELLIQYYDEYFITMNFEFNIANASVFPLVVIGVTPSELYEPVYGRLLPEPGSAVPYEFTLYIYQKFNASPDNNYLDASILSSRLASWLVTKNQNPTEMNGYGIWDVKIGSVRPSETGIGELARYIMNVSVEALRIDSS